MEAAAPELAAGFPRPGGGVNLIVCVYFDEKQANKQTRKTVFELGNI